MPRLLALAVRQPYVYLNPDRPGTGEEARVQPIRLYADVQFGPDPPLGMFDDRPQAFAIVDTGADISVFPYDFWQPLADADPNLITWLHGDNPPGRRLVPYALPTDLPPISDLGRVIVRRSVVLGGTYPALLGRIWVTVRDGLERQLPAVPVVALFRLDSGSQLLEPLLGLQASVLTGRQLTRRTVLDPDEFQDEEQEIQSRNPGYPTDDGPPNGQVWDLTI